jgi:hypothetical protein
MPGRYVPRCVASLTVVFNGDTNERPAIVQRVPVTASVHSNGPNEADTFEIEFDGKELPFPPDVLEGAGLDIYLFQLDGVTEAHDPSTEQFRAEDLAIAGLIDEATEVAGEDENGARVRLTGRDYTALLLDKPWPDGLRFPTGRPIDEVVQDLVDDAVHAEEHNFTLKVSYIGEAPGTDAPVVGGTGGGSATFGRVTKRFAKKTGKLTSERRGNQTITVGAKGQVTVKHVGAGATKLGKRGHAVKAGSSYWDVITRQCENLGLICFVRDRELLITTPPVLIEAADLVRNPGRGLVETRSFKLMWGRNLSHLEVQRHIGGVANVPTVVVRSYDPKTQKAIEGRWPEGKDAERLEARVSGIGTKKSEVLNEEFLGVTDPGVLQQIAKMKYHALARTESRTKFATADLKDLDGNNLLPMRAMDAVKVGYDAFHREDLLSLPPWERIDPLLALGYQPEIAQIIADNLEKLHQFERPLYVVETTMRWDVEEGISIDGEAMNFVDKQDDLR